ncbi:hypothetical protein N7493_006590 [Penicillium malachiteum]|uniref:Profilin n=1 Tax=Penicillium malachiteum TaxID=1324776 RepID=A0AAD6MVN5_9EURO|nr:hypothetical protein N7493_006590 [Penicillium malachiteum]
MQNPDTKAFTNLDQTKVNGLTFNGKKYFTLNAEPGAIYLKKGSDGSIIRKTKQSIIVTEYDGPLQQGESAPLVNSFADYLEAVGY